MPEADLDFEELRVQIKKNWPVERKPKFVKKNKLADSMVLDSITKPLYYVPGEFYASHRPRSNSTNVRNFRPVRHSSAVRRPKESRYKRIRKTGSKEDLLYEPMLD